MMELNPNHPMTSGIREHWHKIVAVMLFKEGGKIGSVKIYPGDLERLHQANVSVAIKEENGCIRVWLVGEKEAKRLAKQEGGLPA